jgi:AraC-like DNA-binding protein
MGQSRMLRSGTTKFACADDYEASIRGAKVDLVFNCQRNFEARLTWVQLRHLRLLCGQENLPRVAHIALTQDLVFISFPHDTRQISDGLEVHPGEIVFHSRGERMHQRTLGPSRWGLIALEPEHLAACSKALTGFDLVAPPVGRILRPSHIDTSHLLRLHAKACRLAETRPLILDRPEVARAIEQDLLHTLVNCLTSNNAHEYSGPKRHHMKIVARFEEILEKYAERQLQIPEICSIIGVSERTLRTCCAEFLGMGPNRYLRLQRLNLVRAALRCFGSPPPTIGEVAQRYGFWELGRFAKIYHTMFGEPPSTTLRCARVTPP